MQQKTPNAEHEEETGMSKDGDAQHRADAPHEHRRGERECRERHAAEHLAELRAQRPPLELVVARFRRAHASDRRGALALQVRLVGLRDIHRHQHHRRRRHSHRRRFRRPAPRSSVLWRQPVLGEQFRCQFRQNSS